VTLLVGADVRCEPDAIAAKQLQPMRARLQALVARRTGDWLNALGRPGKRVEVGDGACR
jgi:hypothetical protein